MVIHLNPCIRETEPRLGLREARPLAVSPDSSPNWGVSSISAKPLAGQAVERPIQQKTKGAETLTE